MNSSVSKASIYRIFACAVFCTPGMEAADLVIHLPESTRVERKAITVTCDAVAVKLGTPPSSFQVEYINAGAISLAVLPVNGKQLVFASVISGSGARYAANRFIWWDAGSRGITLSAPGSSGEDRGSCRVLPSGR
jgi:membrane-bound inhibitor of C-type lysozyme